VTVENLDTGARSTIDCDTVITTGDWIPDHELARTGGIELDPATRGPLVNANLQTTTPGVFAVRQSAPPRRHRRRRSPGWPPRRTQDRRLAPNQSRSAARCSRAGRPAVPLGGAQLITPDGAVSARGDLLLWVDEYHRVPTLRATPRWTPIGVKRTLWPLHPAASTARHGRSYPMPTRQAVTSQSNSRNTRPMEYPQR